jgi:hypothetical protein
MSIPIILDHLSIIICIGLNHNFEKKLKTSKDIFSFITMEIGENEKPKVTTYLHVVLFPLTTFIFNDSF